MIKSLVLSLALTLLIELSLSLLLGVRKRQDIVIIICANTFTNPMVVFVSGCVFLQYHTSLAYGVTVAVMELFALLAEYFIYKKCLCFDKIPPFWLSLLNNATSFGLGLVITNVL